MLNIKSVKHLARNVNFTVDEICELKAHKLDYLKSLYLIDPSKVEKEPRDVLVVSGRLREFQKKLLTDVLMVKLTPSLHNHGGVKKRSVKTNFSVHLGSKYYISADISKFFPSIHNKKVYEFFMRQGCIPDVARICTDLCTSGHKLSLGLLTSPFLADQILKVIDNRLSGLCQEQNLTYSRFVDDIVISGGYDFSDNDIGSMVREVLENHGFKAKASKTQECVPINANSKIVGLCLVNKKPDVPALYIENVKSQLSDCMRIQNLQHPEKFYCTKDQVLGRINYACWVNKKWKRPLMRLFQQIKWNQVENNARLMELVAPKKKLSPTKD